MITNFTLKSRTNIRGQAVEFVRNLIAAGHLVDGEKLPPTSVLAERWGMPVGSAQAVMAQLAADGMVTRQPGKGTFVSRGVPPLTAVAIYTTAEALANPESGVQRAILAELQRQLADTGMLSHMVVDPREGKAMAEPWEPMLNLWREHRVGAGIAACTNQYLLSWMTQLPRIAAFVRCDKVPGQVFMDYEQMGDVLLDGLVSQGCRKVGLMCALRSDSKREDGALHPDAAFYEHFIGGARDRGLRIDDHCIRMAPVGTRAGEFGELGHRLFGELWDRSGHPDGLAVYPDSFMPGILLAMAERGVRAPGDLCLAYHRNEQSPLMNPFPSVEAVLREREIAGALISQVRKVYSGKPCPPHTIGFHRRDRT